MLQNMQDWLDYVKMVAREELPRPAWLMVGLDPGGLNRNYVPVIRG